MTTKPHAYPDAAARPRVGDTVHYVSYGTPGGEFASQCRAATVASVVTWTGDNAAQAWLEQWPVEVDLVVLNPNGLFFNQACPQSEHEHRGGTWHTRDRCPA